MLSKLPLPSFQDTSRSAREAPRRSAALLSLALLALAAAPASAAPVQYDFDSGFVTLTASVGGVDISPPVTTDLVGTQVTIDASVPELVSLELDAIGPISLALPSPFAGDLVIESLSLSGSSGLLVPLDPGPPAEFFFLVDPLAIELVVQDPSAPPFTSMPIAIATESAASGSLFVSADGSELSLSGITLGVLDLDLGVGSNVDPLVLKADFVFSGSPIPEPSAALLYALGALTLACGRRIAGS